MPAFQDCKFTHAKNSVMCCAWGICEEVEVKREPDETASNARQRARQEAYRELIFQIGVCRGVRHHSEIEITSDAGLPSGSSLEAKSYYVPPPESASARASIELATGAGKSTTDGGADDYPRTRFRYKKVLFSTYKYTPGRLSDPYVTSWEVPKGNVYQLCPHCSQPARYHGWIGQTLSVVCPGDLVAMTADGTVFTIKPGALPQIADRILDPLVLGWYWCKVKPESAPRPLFWYPKTQRFHLAAPELTQGIDHLGIGWPFHHLHLIIAPVTKIDEA